MLSDPFLSLFKFLFRIVVLVEDPNMDDYTISNRGSQVLIGMGTETRYLIGLGAKL